MHLISTIARAKVYYWPCGKWAHNYRLQYKFCTIIIKYQSKVKSSFTSLLHVLLRFCIIISFEIGAFMHWIYINLIMWLWLRKTWDMGLWVYNCFWLILLCGEFLFFGLLLLDGSLAITLLKINKSFSILFVVCNIYLPNENWQIRDIIFVTHNHSHSLLQVISDISFTFYA